MFGIAQSSNQNTNIKNNLKVIYTLILTNVADALMDPKSVLTWILISLGSPSYLTSLLVPIRESLALIPQVYIAQAFSKVKTRKYIWIAGALLQGLFILGMLIASYYFDGIQAGIGILLALIGFSLARATCSLSIKDIMGKCVDKSVRGRISGLATTLSSIAVIVLSAYMLSDSEFVKAHSSYLFITAAMAWFIAVCFMLFLSEPQSAIKKEKSTAGNWIKLIKSDPLLQQFVLSRACLMMSGLSAPYVLMLAQKHTSSEQLLAQFMLAASLAKAISPVFWGYFADYSSKKVMQLSAIIATVVCILTIATELFSTQLSINGSWIFALLFFILAIAHAGVRIGRSTYLVNMAKGDKRTRYVSISNSLIGFLLLIVGAIAGGLSALGIIWTLIFFALLGGIALISLKKLPEMEVKK